MPFQTGQLTAVLLADVEGSSRMWDTYPIEMRKALTLYDELVLDAAASRGQDIDEIEKLA